MRAIDRALRYWHTLRYLRLAQFYGRAYFRLRRPRLRAALSGYSIARNSGGLWQPPARRPPSMLGPDRFVFLNEEHTAASAVIWNDPTLEMLWLYNLHYFDDLNALGAEQRSHWHARLLGRWIVENMPPGTGWEPYPTALRIVNWIKWALSGNILADEVRSSLVQQTDWLMQELEWHLLGNHLFANAKALIFAGVFFDGDEASRWLAEGLRIVARELPEQVLRDGGNFERSPMYHSLFLEDLLDLINIAAAFPDVIDDTTVSHWKEITRRMMRWLDGMTHPDGEIALFNDAAFGIAPAPAELRAYARRLGLPAGDRRPVQVLTLQEFCESGYLRLEAPSAVALIDVAPVGPDYLPGHAHADTLSFELSIHGHRVVVNGGTSRYGLGPERERERSTASHSTVEVDGENSSEVWSGFRVARRAKPLGLECYHNAEEIYVACAHDGYRRLPGRVLHRREWRFRGGGLAVHDTLSGSHRQAIARFIVHPDVELTKTADTSWSMTVPGGPSVNVTVDEGTATVQPACYAPRFGESRPTRCIAVEFENASASTQFDWF